MLGFGSFWLVGHASGPFSTSSAMPCNALAAYMAVVMASVLANARYAGSCVALTALRLGRPFSMTPAYGSPDVTDASVAVHFGWMSFAASRPVRRGGRAALATSSATRRVDARQVLQLVRRVGQRRLQSVQADDFNGRTRHGAGTTSPRTGSPTQSHSKSDAMFAPLPSADPTSIGSMVTVPVTLTASAFVRHEDERGFGALVRPRELHDPVGVGLVLKQVPGQLRGVRLRPGDGVTAQHDDVVVLAVVPRHPAPDDLARDVDLGARPRRWTGCRARTCSPLRSWSVLLLRWSLGSARRAWGPSLARSTCTGEGRQCPGQNPFAYRAVPRPPPRRRRRPARRCPGRRPATATTTLKVCCRTQAFTHDVDRSSTGQASNGPDRVRLHRVPGDGDILAVDGGGHGDRRRQVVAGAHAIATIRYGAPRGVRSPAS